MKTTNLSKLTALITAIMLVCGLFTVTAAADQIIVADTDTFDTYAVSGMDTSQTGTGPVTGYENVNTDIESGDVILAEDESGNAVWSAMASLDSDRFGGWDLASAGIIPNPTDTAADGDNVLALEARSVWNYYTATPKIRYDGGFMSSGCEYVYKFDFYRDDTRVGNGIRFNMTGNSWYELVFDGENSESDTAMRTKLLKCTGGAVSVLDADISMNTDVVFGTVWTNYNRLQDHKWYTLELTVYKGLISWVVKYPEYSESYPGEIVQNGRCIDAVNPIDADGMQAALFARGQGGYYVYFDNFSISQNIEIEDDGSFSAFSLTEETVSRGGETLIGIQASGSMDKQLAGRWKIKQSKDGQEAGYDNAAVFAIANDPADDGIHGNVLKIESRAAIDSPWSYPMAYNTRMTTSAGTDYIYKFDINREAGGGIRFNFSGEGSNTQYYELLFSNDHSAENKVGTVLSKKQNGVRTALAADIATYDSIGGTVWTGSNAIVPDRWYSVELSVTDGFIYWTIFDTNGVIVQTGSFEDTDYMETDSMQTVFFGACQGGQYVYFDNISIETLLEDKGDFSNYSLTEATFDRDDGTFVGLKSDDYADKRIAGNWFIKQNKTGQLSRDAIYAITNDPKSGGSHGNVLQIESRSAWDYPDRFPMVYNKNIKITSTEPYLYSFAILRDTANSGGGIRFNYSGSVTGDGGDANYYELFFNRQNGVQLAKCTNGVYTTLDTVVVTNDETSYTYWSGKNALRPEAWYTVEVEVDKGNISWTVNDEAIGWWQTGSCIDKDPLPVINTQPALFSAGQYTNYTYFDNVSIVEIAEDNGTFEKQKITGNVNALSAIDRRLSGNWYIRGSNSDETAGYDNNAVYAIEANPKGSGKVLKIESRVAYNGEHAVPTVYNKTWQTNSDEKNTMQFDIYKTDSRIGASIRFNYSKEDKKVKSFYQLTFEGTNGTRKTVLKKLTSNATSLMETLSPEITGDDELLVNVWYTVKLTVDGGNIRWVVTKTNDGSVVQTGSYTDGAPLAGKNLMTLFAAQGQGGCYVYFDNVSLTTGEPVTEYAITACDGTSAKIDSPETNTEADIIFAAYNNGELTSVSYEKANLTAGHNSVRAKSDFKTPSIGEVKVLLWKNMKPMCGVYAYNIKPWTVMFPNYTTKAATFSVDASDIAKDSEIINLMHAYGINATFNLRGADSSSDYSGYRHEDFEIANNTTHIEMYLTTEYTDDNGSTVTPPAYDDCVASIEAAEGSIETNLNVTPIGLVWPYFAPEERAFYNDLIEYAERNGYKYIRDSHTNGLFDIPSDWLDWHMTAWACDDSTESVLALYDKFAGLEADENLKLFSVATETGGVSSENINEFYGSLFGKISAENIWKATNGEIYNYIHSANMLCEKDGQVYNPSDITIYFVLSGRKYVAEPCAYAQLAE